MTTEDDGRLGELMPNALLILATIDSFNVRGRTSSPKSDDIGWRLGKDAAWVHRHGKPLEGGIAGLDRLATLSRNGHCFLTREGAALAARLRATDAVPEPRQACDCGAGREGPCRGGRQMFGCGRVVQWCPDNVPGLPRAEMSPRHRRAQHEGVWFEVARCPDYALRMGGRTAKPNRTSDGCALEPGLAVRVNRGCMVQAALREPEGEILAAAGGVALVDWAPIDGFAAVRADLMLASDLVTPGALDLTGLSDHQEAIVRAYREGQATFRHVDGTLTGSLHGRTINPRTVGILEGYGLVAEEAWDPEPAPAGPSPR